MEVVILGNEFWIIGREEDGLVSGDDSDDECLC